MSEMFNANWEVLERRRMSIFPVVLLMYAYTKHLEKLVGHNHRHFIMGYKNGELKALRDKDDWHATAENAFNYVLSQPDSIRHISKRFGRLITNLDYHSNLMGSFTGNIAGDEAFSLFNIYCDLYIQISLFGECIPYTIKEILSCKLQACLSKYGDPAELMALFSVPDYQTYTQREERALLEKFKMVKKGADMDAMVEGHHKGYSWINYDYDGDEWSFEDIRKRFENGLMGTIDDIEAKIRRMDEALRSACEKQQKLIYELKIDDETRRMIQILQDSIVLMDIKKDRLTRVHYNTRGFFEKIAGHLGIGRIFTSFIMPYELKEVIEAKRIDGLLKRYAWSAVYVSEAGWRLFSRDEYERLNIINGINNGHSVCGMCAYPGIVAGRVRIIRNVDDARRFESGDILLTTMTTVDFLEAMKRASAIVTDDGGVICHAAIVSRELKIPCLVGTKNATDVFKDGDYVTLDSGKGVIVMDKGRAI